MILTMGILAMFCNVFLIQGIVAWVMGSGELKKMKAGLMDRSGETLTMVGMIFGIIWTVLPLLFLLMYVIFFVIVIVFSVAANA